MWSSGAGYAGTIDQAKNASELSGPIRRNRIFTVECLTVRGGDFHRSYHSTVFRQLTMNDNRPRRGIGRMECNVSRSAPSKRDQQSKDNRYDLINSHWYPE